MTEFVKSPVLSELVKREYDPFYNREHVTLSGAKFALGTPVAESSGKHVAISDPANETAVGLVLFETDASAADKPGVILARGPAVVAEDKIAWPAGFTDEQKTAVLSQLKELGIVGRTSV